MEKYLKINNDPNIEGDFVETTDTNAPFVVVNFQDQEGDYWSNTFKLDFRYKIFNKEIRDLCESKYVYITNADIIPLENATGAVVREKAYVNFRKQKDQHLWEILKKGIYIELTGPKEVEGRTETNSSFNSSVHDVNKVVDLNANFGEATSDTTNVITWEFDIPSKKKQLDSSKAITTQTNSKELIIPEKEEIKINDKKNVIGVETSKELRFESIQYLISGHDGETFFFDGSPTNKTGASFKIEYDSKTMRGEFSLIVDFNNLKAINPGFRRCVIKMVNNEASIKEASSFIMIEKGQAHYSEQDKVWMVDKPLIIKLLK